MSAGRSGRNFIDEMEAVLKQLVCSGPQFAYSHFTIYFLHEFGLNLVPNFTYVYPISCIVWSVRILLEPCRLPCFELDDLRSSLLVSLLVSWVWSSLACMTWSSPLVQRFVARVGSKDLADWMCVDVGHVLSIHHFIFWYLLVTFPSSL